MSKKQRGPNLTGLSFTALLIALALLLVGVIGAWQMLDAASRFAGIFTISCFSLVVFWRVWGWLGERS